ncbi:MAG: SusC/RagA family TonB-linked outer membrane protein [Breznakibacter sp.]
MMKKKRLLRVALSMLLLLSFSFMSFGQNLAIQGSVKDENGALLPGVTVLAKGTTTGTITDGNGAYSLSVPADSKVLVFSFIGMVSQEIQISSSSTINVILREDAFNLQEVVAVGYGVQRKEAITGSVANIKGDIVREVPSANVSQALQGRVAGVEMLQTSSKPGAAMQIRIRGTRSLNATNDPLVVLDGIPFAGTIGDINPSDIKSIDILKDASATAIYGSRGANGVILISTNKGNVGQEAKFTYNGYTGIKDLYARYPMMNNTEFVALRKAAGKYTNGVDEADDVNTDWQDLLYRTANVTSHDIGVTGGSARGTYNIGIGYYKDESLLPGQDYSRLSARANIEQELGKIFKIGFSSNNMYATNNGSNLGLYNTLSTTPISNPRNEDGTWKRTVKMPADETWVYSRDIIENLGDKWKDQTKSFGSYNTLWAEVKIPGVEGLKYRLNLGGNLRSSNGGSYTGEGVFNVNEKTESTASISNSLTTNWAVENLLTYDRNFGKHQVNVVGLYSAEETLYNRSYISAKNIPSDDFQYFNLGRAEGDITIDPNEQKYEKSGLISLMGRAMYSYDNRYMLSVTVRSDGSSRLAKGHQYHTYPAVSAGWNIKNEAFMSNFTKLDALKIRAGYGQTSNQAVAPYSTLGLLNTRPYNFGDDEYTTGYYVSELSNDKLGWEFSETINLGVDFGFFGNRLSGSAEYYVTNTKDLLYRVNLPSTAGVSSYMANVGESQNKGFELALNGVILENLNGFTWDFGVNFYSNKNELVSLASGLTRDENNWWFVGHPINVIFDYEKQGLWNESDPDYQFLQKYEPGGNVGMIKVKYTGEYNADGSPTRSIGAADRQIIDVNPDFQGGFNTRLAYKGFDLSVVGAFQSGGVLISSLYSSNGYLNMLSGRRGNVKVDYWTPENTDAKYPKPGGIASGDNPKYGSTMGYFDASYVKLRSITLGYDFKQNWMSTVGIGKFRLYATVTNPIVLYSPYHKETGMDPETNSYGNENAAVTDTYKKRLLTIGTNSPSTRNFLVGMNISF